MNYSAHATPKSFCIEESFDHPHLTAFGGANLLVDLLRNQLKLRGHFDRLPFQKSIFATYTLADELETLIAAYALGCERIFHSDDIEHDPLLHLKLGLKKLPHHNTLYRALDRFFEGQTRAAVHVELRNGHAPDAKAKVAFYRHAKDQLPKHAPVHFVRADRGFTSEDFLAALEADKVGCTLKVRMTSGLTRRLGLGVLWERLHSHETTHIEVGSIPFKADGWSKRRRIVLIRTRMVDEDQPRLFAEYAWEYQAIVTDREWHPEDVWHFYNQRCTCETLIKEMKGSLGIDAISKADFWPNAADLWIKTIAYNALLHMKNHVPAPYKTFSIARLRRAFLRVPATLVYHARRWRLRLPRYWPHQSAWEHLRQSLHPV